MATAADVLAITIRMAISSPKMARKKKLRLAKAPRNRMNL
jgi:hypothetical protein